MTDRYVPIDYSDSLQAPESTLRSPRDLAFALRDRATKFDVDLYLPEFEGVSLTEALHLKSKTEAISLVEDPVDYYPATIELLDAMGNSFKACEWIYDEATEFVRNTHPQLEKLAHEYDGLGLSTIIVSMNANFDNGQFGFIVRNLMDAVKQAEDPSQLTHRIKEWMQIEENEENLQGLFHTVFSLMKSDDLKLKNVGNEFLNAFVGLYGFSKLPGTSPMLAIVLGECGATSETMRNAWIKRMAPYEGHEASTWEALKRDAERMVQVEAEEAGATQFIVNNLGVTSFARFPLDLLLKQYREQEPTGRPQGIILDGVHDWNNASHDKTQRDIIEEFSKQNEQAGFDLHIAEARSVREAKMRIKRVASLYGPLSYAVIRNHGSKYLILFDNSPEGTVRSDDFGKTCATELRECFVKDPVIISESCYGGGENGIAQRISELGCTAMGSRGKAFFTSLSLFPEGEFVVDATFSNNNLKSVFKNGKRI